MDKDEQGERYTYSPLQRRYIQPIIDRNPQMFGCQEPVDWITSYQASLALECTFEEMEKRIALREIHAIPSESSILSVVTNKQGEKELKNKFTTYWKVVDQYVLSEHAKLQEEIDNPEQRTERYTRYCARKESDDRKHEEVRKRIEERVKAERQKRKEQKQ